METFEFGVIIAVLILFTLISKRIQTTPFTAPMIFVVCGALLGPTFIGFITYDFSMGAIHSLAELWRAPAIAGALAPNDDLRAAELLAVGAVRGPEDVAVDAAGRVVLGTREDAFTVLQNGEWFCPPSLGPHSPTIADLVLAPVAAADRLGDIVLDRPDRTQVRRDPFGDLDEFRLLGERQHADLAARAGRL